MSVPIRTVRPGDPISAARFNEVVDALNALAQISGVYPIEVEHDAAGVRIALAHQFKAWLFRIQTVPSVIPRTDDDVPYYSGTRVRLDSDNSYTAQSPQDVRLYDPLAKTATVKTLTEGTWVLATFDTDAGRWHLVRDPFVGPAIVRFRLDGTLTLGGSAPAHIRKWDPTAGGGAGAYVDGDAITVKDYFGALGDPGEWQAPNGYFGFAVKLADLDEYQILYMERQARFAVATLTADISGGTASATFASFWEGRSTGTATGVVDRDGNHANLKTGDKVIVTWDSKLEQYVIISGKVAGVVDFCRFKLYGGALSLGGSQTAKQQIWDAGASDYVDGPLITVVDYYGSLGRRGKFQGPSGLYGYAVKFVDKDEWQILDMERIALFAEVTLTENMGATTAQEAAATFDEFWEGQTTAGATTVSDVYERYPNARTGDKFLVGWNDFNADYRIIVGKPADQSTKYAVAYDNMVLAATAKSNDHYIQARICSDELGTDPTGDPFPIYCPSRSNDREPNGQTGSVWEFTIGPSGRAVATGGYLSAARGFIDNWYGSADSIPFGWILCDGGNATNNGTTFTAPDLRAKFVLGGQEAGGTTMDDDGNNETIGTQGGTLKHKHADHLPKPVTYTTLSATTAVPSIQVDGYIQPATVTGYAVVPSQYIQGTINPSTVSGYAYVPALDVDGYIYPTALTITTSGYPIEVDIDLDGETACAPTGLTIITESGTHRHKDHTHHFSVENVAAAPVTTPSVEVDFWAVVGQYICIGSDVNDPSGRTAPSGASSFSDIELSVVSRQTDASVMMCVNSATGLTSNLDMTHTLVEPYCDGTGGGHKHNISGTATVTISTDDLGLSIYPNPHTHSFELLTDSVQATLYTSPHAHTFNLYTYSTNATLVTDPHSHVFSLFTETATAPTTIYPNPHSHDTPTLKHTLEYHTSPYYALAYIMRAY